MVRVLFLFILFFVHALYACEEELVAIADAGWKNGGFHEIREEWRKFPFTDPSQHDVSEQQSAGKPSPLATRRAASPYFSLTISFSSI